MEDERLGTKLDVFLTPYCKLVMYDDGTHNDENAGDLIYTTTYKENINTLINQIKQKEQYLISKGSYVKYTGHIAELKTDIPYFDVTKFNNFDFVAVSPEIIINGVDCVDGILKQNSLLITDLSVVEDHARTYNVKTEQGASDGCWTFGYMIKNIANEAVTGVSASEVFKNWVKNWTDEQGNITTVDKRYNVFTHLIIPWIKICQQRLPASITLPYASSSIADWEANWDAIPQDILLANAPFRLMAIANRLD